MRVMHVLNHVKNSGNGIVNVAVDLACLQSEDSHEVSVVSSGGSYQTLLEEHGVQHLTLNLSRSPIKIIQATLEFSKMIKQFKPDIIHAHMLTGVVLSWMLKNFNCYSLVSTVHNEFQHGAVLMGLADQVIAVSEAVAKSMISRGISANKVGVVRNGTIDSPRLLPVNSYKPQELCRPAIVTVCGMYKRKGVQDLISAFDQIASNHPSANLYLVGDGPDKENFEAQAQESLASDRIHFEGFQVKPQRYLLSADVFVLASHRDPCPLVISEAREAGCAIVASNVDGIPELLSDGEAGLLVSPCSTSELAEALNKVLESKELLNNLQERASKNLDCLNVSRVLEETLSVYEELLIA